MEVVARVERFIEDAQYMKKGDLHNAKSEGIRFCCDEMKSAWDKHFIGFGEFDDFPLNHDLNVNIFNCRPYPEGAVWDEMPIKFCPFCGEKVEVRIVELNEKDKIWVI